MAAVTARHARWPAAGEPAPDLHTLGAEAAAAVLADERFGRGLSVTRAARRAVSELGDQLIAGRRLGLILATDHGDQHVLARRLPDFARQMRLEQPPPTDLFRAIAYFPVGRVAQAIAAQARAEGPVASVPNDLDQARALAQIWLETGRADQIVVVAAEATDDGAAAEATAELWMARPRVTTAPALAFTACVSHDAAGPCAGLAASVIEPLAGGHRTALIVGSMLAEAGESLFAELSPRDAGPPLAAAVRLLAARLGFSETFVMVGSSGAAMNALALAQDLIALDRADAAVVCGVDLVDGALAQALGVLHCGDLPHMRGGATAIRLEPARAGSSLLRACTLVNPRVPPRPGAPADLDGIPARLVDGPAPEQVVLSGLSSPDLACAQQLAAHVWPGVPITSRGEVRSVAADPLRLAGTVTGPTGMVSAHAFGGSGCCVIA